MSSAAVGRAVAISRARELLDAHRLTAPPVPVERIAKALGARVRYAPLDDALSGMAYIKDGVPIIGVNSLHHPNRQRFTIAHEIAHLVLHRDLITAEVHVDKAFVLNRDGNSATGTDALEVDANAFAAELLVPAEWLRRSIAAQADLDSEDEVAALAKRFRVSTATLQNRLLSLTRDPG